MKFNLKVILLGGLAYYVAQFLVSLGTGPFIHEGILVEVYMAHSLFWRPELVADNAAALMPRWITTGIIMAFLQVGIYDNIRSALDGSGWLKGMKFGVIAFLFYMAFSAGWSGIFNLPETLWMWWNIEALLVFLVGGAVMGIVVNKLSSD
jgi:hypothetical protein